MLLQGDIVNTPNHDYACRTQIEFKTSLKQAKLLKDKNLGNHHLIFPVESISKLVRVMEHIGIDRVS